MSQFTIKILEDSRKLREDIRIRREALKRDLTQSSNAVATATKKTMARITPAEQRK